MSNLQTLAAWVGLLGGAAGFISVLLNWWQIRVDSPRIILDLKFAYSTANVKEFCSIEVIKNVSSLYQQQILLKKVKYFFLCISYLIILNERIHLRVLSKSI